MWSLFSCVVHKLWNARQRKHADLRIPGFDKYLNLLDNIFKRPTVPMSPYKLINVILLMSCMNVHVVNSVSCTDNLITLRIMYSAALYSVTLS